MSFSVPDHLPRAILEVLVYFDLFAHPLTTLEVWKNLRIKASFQEVQRVLTTSPYLQDRLECKAGMWKLRGSVSERASRYRASKYKLDIAKKFVSGLRFVPGVVSAYACNTLGFLGSKTVSDIDLFISVQRGRIWTVRFFAVLLAKLLFGRPQGTQHKDTLCLSFFAVEGGDLQKLALPGGDVYYEYWLKNLLLLFKKSQKGQRGRMKVVVECLLRWLQLKMMPARLKAMANQGTSVVLTDTFLKFHDHDRREYYRQQFRARFAAVSA